ncbi:MAG: hypothetical protein NW205_02520 [Hyphomicrobiaceae bacterium]|nr:hypothetical protein [Hyphomicrobiaceae bacterium]
MTPDHLNPAQWAQAQGYARQACARVFRDGGTPAEALEAFGVDHGADRVDWSRAVELIAHALCASPALKRAA